MKCHLCEATFKRKGDFKRHLKTIHEKLKRFECKKCEKEFVLEHYLKRHVNQMHKSPTLNQGKDC